MSHTPGPWRVTSGTGAFEVRDEAMPSVRICRVLRTDSDNYAANAAAIAALPMLLDAAKEMCAAFEQYDERTGKGMGRIAVAHNAVLAAIAKAEGK